MTTLPQNLGYNIPALSIQFDDGYTSVYTEAFAYMSSKSIPGNAYVYENTRGPSDAQLQEMYAAGWDICNHTDSVTAASGLSAFTLEQQETALSACASALDALGFTRSSKHVTYPQGLYNADTLTAMTNTGMLTGKTTSIQGREKMYHHTANPFLNMFYAYNSAYSDAFVIDYFEACIASKQHATILFHDIVASGATGNQCNRANFRTLIDWIYDNRVIVLTASQIYSLMSGSIEI